MQICAAKLVNTRSADHGYVYPTYEYTDSNGQVKQIESDSAIMVHPWDITKTHHINIQPDGSLNTNNPRTLIVVGCILAALSLITIVGPLFGSMFFGFIFIAIALIPTIVSILQCYTVLKRRKNARNSTPIQGKVIWYHEIRKRRRQHTTTYHYPIVEYVYQGQRFYAILPDREEPVSQGEIREFYLDIQHKDIFTDKSCKLSGPLLKSIMAPLITMPFMIPGFLIIAKNMPAWISPPTIGNNWDLSQFMNFSEMFDYISWYVIGLFLLPMIIILLRKWKILIAIKKAQRYGSCVHATYIKTNKYGRDCVRVYEYTHRGQVCTYQSKYTRKQQRYQHQSKETQDALIELYIHPNTNTAYSKRDEMMQKHDITTICLMVIISVIVLVPLGM